MGKIEKQRLLSLSMLSLWMSIAAATPPANQKPALHLDLHPPSASLGMEKAAAAFPLPRRPSGPQDALQLPNLGAEGAQARVPSRVEDFARRVHKEGLPVAKLWENKSALVTLGTQSKGRARVVTRSKDSLSKSL